MEPKADLKGLVEVKLEAKAEVSIAQKGSIKFQAGYDDGWTASSTQSFTKTTTIEVKGEASAKAEGGVVLTLGVSVYGLIGLDLGVYGGIRWEAKAQLVSNLVLLQAITPFEFTQFDLYAFIEGPVTGTSIFGDKEFGNLFSLPFMILTLPAVELKKVTPDGDAVRVCPGDGNALVLQAEAKQLPYEAFISNDIVPLHKWLDDFDPEDDIVAKQYKIANDDTTTVTLSLSRNVAKQIHPQPYTIPSGKLWFRTTPAKLFIVPVSCGPCAMCRLVYFQILASSFLSLSLSTRSSILQISTHCLALKALNVVKLKIAIFDILAKPSNALST
jgi:hypothetical protein